MVAAGIGSTLLGDNRDLLSALEFLRRRGWRGARRMSLAVFCSGDLQQVEHQALDVVVRVPESGQRAAGWRRRPEVKLQRFSSWGRLAVAQPLVAVTVRPIINRDR